MRASEIPGATARNVAAPAVPSPWNASIMPHTVPNSPIKGVIAPVVASQGKRRSRRVNSSDAAICIERRIASRLRIVPLGFPTCRRYSSYPPSNTATRGLGLNCSATAEISCSRWALRKARTKRPLWLRARPNRAHLERMIPQESTLNPRRIRRTTLATRPLS